jgi:hypothetical protein
MPIQRRLSAEEALQQAGAPEDKRKPNRKRLDTELKINTIYSFLFLRCAKARISSTVSSFIFHQRIDFQLILKAPHGAK